MRFATDLRNLTLASPEVNRRQKSGKDAAEWTPDRNKCWFAGRVLEEKRAYQVAGSSHPCSDNTRRASAICFGRKRRFRVPHWLNRAGNSGDCLV